WRSRSSRLRSPEQRDIDHVEPAKNAVDDRPQDRMGVGIGDSKRQRRAKTDAVFRALDPNPVVSVSVHGEPPGRSEQCAAVRAILPYGFVVLYGWRADATSPPHARTLL